MSEEVEKKPEVVEEPKPTEDSSDDEEGATGHNWDNDDVNVDKSWLERSEKDEKAPATEETAEAAAPHKEHGEKGGRGRGNGKKGGYPRDKHDRSRAGLMPQSRPFDGYFTGFPSEWKQEDIIKYLSENPVENVKAEDIVEVVIETKEGKEGKTYVCAYIEFRTRNALLSFLSFNGKKTPEGSPSEAFKAQVRIMKPYERAKREEEVKKREKEKRAQAEKERKEREEAERKKKEAEAAEAKRKQDREKTLKGIERSKEMKKTGKGRGKKRIAGDGSNMFAGLDELDEE